MGKILDMIKTRRQEVKNANAERKEMNRDIVKQLRPEYKKAMIEEATKAIKLRASKEAMNKYGYTKAEKRARILNQFTKELGSLGDRAVGNIPTKTIKTKKHKPIKKKATNPFDLGDFNDFNMGSL